MSALWVFTTALQVQESVWIQLGLLLVIVHRAFPGRLAKQTPMSVRVARTTVMYRQIVPTYSARSFVHATLDTAAMAGSVCPLTSARLAFITVIQSRNVLKQKAPLHVLVTLVGPGMALHVWTSMSAPRTYILAH